ncbi:cyclin-dependent kinase inhibitor 1-like [Sinocyclocheilus anshuiensis]|uniref:cyclin-dependent kinase inhibitor 1-like n=1 Tax=Sinocyclocheilus anshuiensis TaxID=1608454 RepID=UPI0007B977F2|nr:PREDICTED: cyclin-dependent kinase inhibitor 1-like [Sinocyclocheilus anshuiensis]XP_016300337.1 PREDICTED: cyclin-dependent kinase inhibitor 1-like [Sinocyclocheilus anshuiensis]
MCFLMQLEVMVMHKRILRALGNGVARWTLFGPVDREQLQLEYHDALRRDLEEASHRWGSTSPLRRLLWAETSSGRACPGSRCPSCTAPDLVPRTPKRYSIVPQNVEKTPEKRTELKRKQTNITDFYLAKKRGVATPRKSGQ